MSVKNRQLKLDLLATITAVVISAISIFLTLIVHPNRYVIDVNHTASTDQAEKVTIQAPEKTTSDETLKNSYKNSSGKTTSVASYSAPRATSNATPSNSYINIGGKSINIFRSSNTTINAGSQVALFGNKFLYGHNTSNVFGVLSGLPVGNTFTVTLDGNTTTYQIAAKYTLSNDPNDPQYVGNYMNAIANATYRGGHYNLALMTCAGENWGGGNASHRLVVFANAI